jgi:alkyl sulfatase BDS1-like metallo-beta-lactamase superfamily hydrolase
MNAGKDVYTLMREVTLPPALQVGEGYGMVRWNIRAIWENYAGWFHHRSTTELYAVAPEDFSNDIVGLAGADAIVGRARKAVADGEPLRAIRLTEIVRHVEPHHDGAKHVLRAAHEQLLEASTNFWESAWLRKQIAELT